MGNKRTDPAQPRTNSKKSEESEPKPYVRWQFLVPSWMLSIPVSNGALRVYLAYLSQLFKTERLAASPPPVYIPDKELGVFIAAEWDATLLPIPPSLSKTKRWKKELVDKGWLRPAPRGQGYYVRTTPPEAGWYHLEELKAALIKDGPDRVRRPPLRRETRRILREQYGNRNAKWPTGLGGKRPGAGRPPKSVGSPVDQVEINGVTGDPSENQKDHHRPEGAPKATSDLGFCGSKEGSKEPSKRRGGAQSAPAAPAHILTDVQNNIPTPRTPETPYLSPGIMRLTALSGIGVGEELAPTCTDLEVTFVDTLKEWERDPDGRDFDEVPEWFAGLVSEPALPDHAVIAVAVVAGSLSLSIYAATEIVCEHTGLPFPKCWTPEEEEEEDTVPDPW
ncbi:hypothetical protein H9Y04_41370 [Streptomyces sp. TRM66268-LWL]|uniref:Uncharacterized protein n=1 Tax=Streptomyces polyasparticus TaxID=2767826 RepID=A0ABR7SVQ2_9ACTN|nr:hypothetical protein [Streptomyces polyasparticus]MBC9718997.1 hypothetical protein [Streptomyces polyasparticus]